MNYLVLYSNRKTVSLHVNPNGEVVVRASKWHPKYLIQKFVDHHQDWIVKQIAAKQKVKKQFVEGGLFLYMGQEYPLRIIQPYHRNKLEFDGETFNLSLTFPSVGEGRLHALFVDWYKTQAKKVLAERLILFAKAMNLHYKRMSIKSTISRWGSCSSIGNINFSYKLIMAPLEVADYVVVHELAHLAHHNHSEKFWQLVEQFCPYYKQRRKWLRVHGGHLTI